MPVIVGDSVTGIQGIGKDISQLKKSNEKLERQAERLNSIFESVTQPFIVIDKKWRYAYVNKIFTSGLGKDTSYFIGKSIWEIFPEAIGSRFYNECHEVVRTGRSAHFDEYIPMFDVTLTYNIYPFPDGITVFFMDITKQKEVESELQKLSLVASKTTNGVVLMDAEGKIEWVNDGFTKLTGYSKQEALGRIPSELLQGPGSDPEAEKRIRDSYKKGVPFSEEVLNFKKNGERFWMHFEITPIFDENGNLTSFVSIETDITELKKKKKKLPCLPKTCLPTTAI
ncbi:hypothetical protein GCM10028895_29680 [Pontibacter rugosus]